MASSFSWSSFSPFFWHGGNHCMSELVRLLIFRSRSQSPFCWLHYMLLFHIHVTTHNVVSSCSSGSSSLFKSQPSLSSPVWEESSPSWHYQLAKLAAARLHDLGRDVRKRKKKRKKNCVRRKYTNFREREVEEKNPARIFFLYFPPKEAE